MKNTSVLILSGGESKRMKQSKSFLKFNDHLTFLEKIISVYLKAGINNIVLVINPLSLNLREKQILSNLEETISVIFNNHPEKGRLYSIKLGLSTLIDYDKCFIQNIDNPFVSPQLIKKMVPLIKSNSYVSPTFNHKGGHPVLLSKSICKQLLQINDRTSTLRDILGKFRKIVMQADELVLININTMEEYLRYFSDNTSYK